MDLYISLENLLKARKKIQGCLKKPDTFAGIVILLLSSRKIQDYYYQADMGKFSEIANKGFTLKDVRARSSEKNWYSLFTPKWTERALASFLSDKPINIYTLLVTIFWQQNKEFIEKQKNYLKEIIGNQDFDNLFTEDIENYFTEDRPISREFFYKAVKGSITDTNSTIKYDGSFIVKDAGDLSASPFSQTLYSGLEIKQIISIFDFNIIGEFNLNTNPIKELTSLSSSGNIAEKTSSPAIKGQNILFYGIAGVGKSHHIKQFIGEDESIIERTVFHPDYLNTDFVGQILPSVNDKGHIDYQFKAGAFTKVLKKAIQEPNQQYYLVIEEINRGNAAAIFGEIFQLLDRKIDGSSSYRISHDLMASYIFNDPNQTIYIPRNLSILATMNTADQNVFTLDTAFQRRWTMRRIANNIDNCSYKNKSILDTNITWQSFNTTINEFILDVNKDTLSSEDKRLGAYFVRSVELDMPINLDDGLPFAEKVIKYLWDDVFKFNKSVLFKDNLNSLDKVLDFFEKHSGIERFDIFNNQILDRLKLASQTIQTSKSTDES
jgi:hypothetical protein